MRGVALGQSGLATRYWKFCRFINIYMIYSTLIQLPEAKQHFEYLIYDNGVLHPINSCQTTHLFNRLIGTGTSVFFFFLWTLYDTIESPWGAHSKHISYLFLISGCRHSTSTQKTHSGNEHKTSTQASTSRERNLGSTRYARSRWTDDTRQRQEIPASPSCKLARWTAC